jgi:hypothetical protein
VVVVALIVMTMMMITIAGVDVDQAVAEGCIHQLLILTSLFTLELFSYATSCLPLAVEQRIVSPLLPIA